MDQPRDLTVFDQLPRERRFHYRGIRRDEAHFIHVNIRIALKRCLQLLFRYAERRTISTGRLLDNPVLLDRVASLSGALAALESLVVKRDEIVVLCLSGRGDKDMETYGKNI